jgi:16S rRNA (cytosine967-C5)-methyltransferase
MKPATGDWRDALRVLLAFDRGRAHLDDLLDDAGDLRLRWLVQAVFRDWQHIGAILGGRLARAPRPVALQLLRLAVAECLNRDEADWPKVVHHAVETARAAQLSPREAGFINAVLRGLMRDGALRRGAARESHPEWLCRRWSAQFGEEALERLLEWNQAVPEIHISASGKPDYAEPTPWDGFYRITRSRFAEALPDLRTGKVYVQDPFTRVPVDLLDPRPGEAVLDLCSAPGGKARLVSARMHGQGRLVLVDQSGGRLARLRENAARFPHPGAVVVGSRLEDLAGGAEAAELQPQGMDAVLIDVPCSNTGVMQKRPDVKVRLREQRIPAHAPQQAALLRLAAHWVRPGGRLVYSTCSLEQEENAGVVEAFCREQPHWRLEQSVLSLPWECGHDGGGAFLLTHDAPQPKQGDSRT